MPSQWSISAPARSERGARCQVVALSCYLIVQSGDPSKPVIANGQTYFAMQARRQELNDSEKFARLSEDEKRLAIRNEWAEHNKYLAAVTVSSDGFVAVTAQTMKEGSKMPRADWKQMQQYKVPCPPDGLLSIFNSFIEPIVQQLKTLSFENRQLGKARDPLLPRLMNGELAV